MREGAGYRDMTSIIQIYIIIIYQLIYAKPSTKAVTAGWGRYDIAYDNTWGGIHPTYLYIIVML